MFRKIQNNPEFKIYYTGDPVPDVYPNTQFTEPNEYWYGFVSDVDIECLFYQNPNTVTFLPKRKMGGFALR